MYWCFLASLPTGRQVVSLFSHLYFMDTPPLKQPLQPLGQFISLSWNQLLERLKLIWPYSAVFLVLLIFSQLAVKNSLNFGSIYANIIIYIVAGLIIYWLGIVLTIRLNWTDKSQSEIIQASLKVYAPLAYLAILSGLVQLGAFFLLFVPAMIASVHFILVYYVRILENIGGYKALTRSRQLVKGHFWPILWRYIVLAFLGALPTLVLGLFPPGGVGAVVSAIIYGAVQAFWAIPFLMLGLLNIAKELIAQKPEPSVIKKGYYIFCSIWGPVGLILIVGAAVILSGLSILNMQKQLDKIDPQTLLQQYQPQINTMIAAGKSQAEIEAAIRDQIISDYTKATSNNIVPTSWADLQNRLKLLPQLKTLFASPPTAK